MRKSKSNLRPPSDGLLSNALRRFQISMDNLVPQVALYPSPDNGVDVTEVEGKHLDGVFIGACTTAEEELILAGLVLEAGLKKGLVPVTRGRR